MADVPVRLKTTYDDKGFKKLKQDAKTINKDILAGAGGALGGALAGGAALKFLKDSVELSIIQAKAEAQVAAAIQSTGGAAGFTTNELKAMASQLQTVTNFGDEATLAMQSVLLTFTQVKGENFERATVAIQDMATRLDTDLRSAALQVGKALQDPVKGATALQRAGIQLTDQQKEQIKVMQEAGNIAGAQAIILGELEIQFGGAAAAAREADGGITGVSNALGDLQEALGAVLTPQKEQTGLVEDALVGYTEMLTKLPLISQAHKDYQGSLEDTAKWQTVAAESAIILLSAGTLAPFTDAILGTLGLAAGNEELAESYAEVLEETEAATEANEQHSISVNKMIPDLKKLEEANKKIAEERKKTDATIRDTARDLIQIDEDAFDDRLDAAKNFQKSVNKIQRDAARDTKKDGDQLGRQLKKIDTDTNKAIKKEQQSNALNQRQERQRSQVETLGDRRLFQLELQNMAEEGDAIGIRRALERRATEEEIAKEKATVEAQISAENERQKVDDIRETSQERKQELKDSAQLEAELRKEDLAIRIADEAGYYQERQALIEEGRLKAVATTAQELTEMNQLTRAQLMGLVPMAGKLGGEVGASFAQGITSGYRAQAETSQLISNNVTVNAQGVNAGELAGGLNQSVNAALQQYNKMLKDNFAR